MPPHPHHRSSSLYAPDIYISPNNLSSLPATPITTNDPDAESLSIAISSSGKPYVTPKSG
ncbi:hypothetical protein KCP69_16625 [Salmonella enterica subsp. enterica]|nr:hypothetical protein KCP69_16625 [Salmonella enterica subsp. enterica]